MFSLNREKKGNIELSMLKKSKRLGELWDLCHLVQFTQFHEIACDHAYLSLAYLQNEPNIKVFASDIAVGPLENAKKNLSAFIKEERLSLFLSNGLDKHPICEDSLVLIAGLGGLAIVSILEAVKEDFLKFTKSNSRKPYILIQAMQNIPVVRVYMEKSGYRLVKASFIQDKNQVYLSELYVPAVLEKKQIIDFTAPEFKNSDAFEVLSCSAESYYFDPVIVDDLKLNPSINRIKATLKYIKKVQKNADDACFAANHVGDFEKKERFIARKSALLSFERELLDLLDREEVAQLC